MKSISQGLKEFIEATTGRQCGVSEVPKDAVAPFYNIHPTASPTAQGDMESVNSIELQVFTVDIVGSNIIQTEEAEHRLKMSLRDLKGSVHGVFGPPAIRSNGTGREDDRTFRAMLVLTIPVTE